MQLLPMVDTVVWVCGISPSEFMYGLGFSVAKDKAGGNGALGSFLSPGF